MTKRNPRLPDGAAGKSAPDGAAGKTVADGVAGKTAKNHPQATTSNTSRTVALGNEVGTRGLEDDVPKFLYHILVAGTCALVAHKTMFSCWPLVVL